MERPKRIAISKMFEKAYRNLDDKRQLRVDEALCRFAENPDDPSLYLHLLEPRTAGKWSISAGGNLRCLFIAIEGGGVVFLALGTHSQLYG